MKKILIILFTVFFEHSYSQDCFEADFSITNIKKCDNKLEYVVLEENDSLLKICWWPSDSFRSDAYKDRKTVDTEIIKTLTMENKLKKYKFRGQVITKTIFIDESKVEFYTVC